MDVNEALATLAKVPTDEEAWRTIYRRFWPYVKAITHRVLRGANELADDASQEVFFRLLKKCPFSDLQESHLFQSYVATVARNVALNHWRELARHTKDGLDTNAPGDEEQFSKTIERNDWLNHLLASFKNVDREIIILLLEGCTLDEIAQKTGLTYSNVGVRLHRARNELVRQAADA